MSHRARNAPEVCVPNGQGISPLRFRQYGRASQLVRIHTALPGVEWRRRLLALAMAGLVPLALAGGLAASAAARGLGPTTSGRVIPVEASLCDDMKLHHVLTAGAPVGCDRLRVVEFSYIDFAGQPRDDGRVMVMDAVADHVLHIFVVLLNRHFPIAGARLMNQFDGNDDASMADNNTSAFNVRDISGGGGASLHSYGLAIDINPVQNPYAVRLGASLTFNPPSAADYANRLDDRPWKARRPGMAEAIVDVFANDGFIIWGGDWDDPIDYQHFQVSRELAEELAQATAAQARVLFEQSVNRYRACRHSFKHGTRRSRSECIVTMVRTPIGPTTDLRRELKGGVSGAEF